MPRRAKTSPRAAWRRSVATPRRTPWTTCLEGLEALDLTRVVATLNPNEFEALQRYAPLFLADAQASLDDSGVTLTADDAEYAVSGDGDQRSVSIDRLHVAITSEEGDGAVTLEDGCWTVEAPDESVELCGSATELPLDDLFEDPQPIEDVLSSFEAAFADYENPGFLVQRVDGQWYISPIATVAEQILAVVGALSRDEIEELQSTIQEAGIELGGL